MDKRLIKILEPSFMVYFICLHDTVGIDIKGNLNLRHAARSC